MRAFVDDETGATAIEYGLIAALVAMAMLASLRNIANVLDTTFSSTSGKVEEVARCVAAGSNCKK
jgi:pilus assembly protein Flp/PilA